MLTLTALIALITITAGNSIAKDEEAKAKAKDIKNPPSHAEMMRETVRQKGVEMDPEERVKRMQERKTEEIDRAKKQPQALIKQLEEIKALAIKENAKETAAGLDKMIEKTKLEMEKKVATIEERHAKFEEFMSNRNEKSEETKSKRTKNEKAKDNDKEDEK